MRQYIENRLKRARLCLAGTLIGLILFIAVLPLSSRLPFPVYYTLVMLSMASALAFSIVYYARYRWLGGCIKMLRQTGRMHLLEDIPFPDPTLADSKLFCGKAAFFSQKSNILLAYSDVAWLYPHEENDAEYAIHLKNGKKLLLPIKRSDLLCLFNSYIAKGNTSVLTGAGEEKRMAYFQNNPEALLRRKAAIAKGGIPLIAFSTAIVVARLIQQSFDRSIIIPVLILFISGTAMLLYGGKYLSIKAAMSNLLLKLRQSPAFHMVCKIATVTSVVSVIGLLVFGPLRIDALATVCLVVYVASIIPFFASIFLHCGFFGTEKEPVIAFPWGYLQDVSCIANIRRVSADPLPIYVVTLSDLYGWEYIKEAVDYMVSADIPKVSRLIAVVDEVEKDLTASYKKSRKKGRPCPELEQESGSLHLVGRSERLDASIRITWHNQTRVLWITTQIDSIELIERYVETMVRRSFGTPDELKRAINVFEFS